MTIQNKPKTLLTIGAHDVSIEQLPNTFLMVAYVDDQKWELSPIPTLNDFLTCNPFIALVLKKLLHTCHLTIVASFTM